jgi:hypothetical protein
MAKPRWQLSRHETLFWLVVLVIAIVLVLVLARKVFGV